MVQNYFSESPQRGLTTVRARCISLCTEGKSDLAHSKSLTAGEGVTGLIPHLILIPCQVTEELTQLQSLSLEHLCKHSAVVCKALWIHLVQGEDGLPTQTVTHDTSEWQLVLFQQDLWAAARVQPEERNLATGRSPPCYCGCCCSFWS